MDTIRLGKNDLQRIVLSVANKLYESVYMKNVNNTKKSIGLTYQKGSDRSIGNYNSFDMLKTDKMDRNDNDTYCTTLKCGLTSYNITSIRGSEVMHYFKNKFSNKKTTVKVKTNPDSTAEDYQLQMMDAEFNEFMKQFLSKVNRVVNFGIENFRKNNGVQFNAVSIFPVPSSSMFNEKMAELMTRYKLGGLPTQVINKDLLMKSLTNLKKDEDFIAKNAEYYKGSFSNKTSGPLRGTVMNHLEKTINQYQKMEKLGWYIDTYNERLTELLRKLNAYNSRDKNVGGRAMQSLVTNYIRLYNTLKFIYKNTTYQNPVSVNGVSRMDFDTYARKLKSSKGPSTNSRSTAIWNLVAPYLRGQVSPIDMKPYTKIDLVYLEKADFQMKALSNGERMGLKDYFAYNKNAEMVRNEIDKIKGTVLVIFDDNISGGATLSDICYQFMKQGIDKIIPITFGEMNKKWQVNFVPLNQPEGGEFNY